MSKPYGLSWRTIETNAAILTASSQLTFICFFAARFPLETGLGILFWWLYPPKDLWIALGVFRFTAFIGKSIERLRNPWLGYGFTFGYLLTGVAAGLATCYLIDQSGRAFIQAVHRYPPLLAFFPLLFLCNGFVKGLLGNAPLLVYLFSACSGGALVYYALPTRKFIPFQSKDHVEIPANRIPSPSRPTGPHGFGSGTL